MIRQLLHTIPKAVQGEFAKSKNINHKKKIKQFSCKLREKRRDTRELIMRNRGIDKT